MRKKSFIKKLFRILAYAKPHLSLLILLIFLSLLLAGLSLVNPYLVKILIDDVLISGNLQKLIFILGVFAGAFILNTVSQIIQLYKSTELTERVSLDVKRELFSHIERLHLGFFHTKKVGDIISRLFTDVYGIQSFIGLVTDTVLIDLLTAIGILIVCLHLNWKVTLLSLTVFPFYVLAQKHYARKVKTRKKSIREKTADILSLLEEDISIIKLIKTYVREKLELSEYTKKARQLINMEIKISLLQSYAGAVISTITFIPLFIILGFGGYQVIIGTLSIGSLIALYTYIDQLFGPVSSLGTINIQAQELMVSVDRVFEFLDTKPKIVDKQDAKVLKKVRGDIAFKNVTFGYEPEEPVLKDISFEVKPGQHIGIVGPSGSGKSTLVNLVCRLFDPDSGKITLDGTDLRDIKISSLRKNIGIVSQEAILFDASVKDNIRFGNLKASDEEILRAAKLADVHGFIKDLPDGYDTIVGEKGVNLSGGQQQRIAIARVLLKDPPVIILDEATSSLDAESEEKVYEALDRVTKGRTTLKITHRLSSQRDADRIIVLKDKKIAEEGTFSELMEKGGVFYELYMEQFGNYHNFQEMLNEELKRSRTLKKPLTMAVVYLTNLEKLVKRHEKEKMEILSERVLMALRSEMRSTDFVERVPHTKNIFYIVLPKTSKKEADEILKKLVDKVVKNVIRHLNIEYKLLSKSEIVARKRQFMKD